MNKALVLAAAGFMLGLSLGAQNMREAPYKSAHYEIQAMDAPRDDLALLGREMELRFGFYNRLFRFDPQAVKSPLMVRVFSGQKAYDSYVGGKLGVSRPGAVYLHYTRPEKRELCVLRGSAEEAAKLSHQAFIQFFRAFIPNPPSWMQEGFAIFFSSLRFDLAAPGQEDRIPGALIYEENLAWLEYMKGLGKDAPSVKNILESDINPRAAGKRASDFQAASWSVVSFFLMSGREEYYRTITDCFMVLSPQANGLENSAAVLKRINAWNDLASLEGNYTAYLQTRKTFIELMEAGIKAYGGGDEQSAELSFMAALDQRPSHYAPYYYLGLLAYDRQNYEEAENYYRSSLNYGADEALAYYVLGINAASAGKTVDAVSWLEKAVQKDPAHYRSKAGEVLAKLK